MKELTARQKEIWDLRQGGKSSPEIGALLGISPNVVTKTLVVVRKKLGVRGVVGVGGTGPVEVTDPGRAVAVLDAMSDPRYEVLAEACRAAGLPERVGSGLIRRLRLKYGGVVVEAKNLQKRELDELLGKKIHLMLHYIDDSVAAQASVRDLAMGAAQLIEKQQLIRGEPTAIVSDHERKKLHELAPALLSEIRRRGLTIPGEVVEKAVESV